MDRSATRKQTAAEPPLVLIHSGTPCQPTPGSSGQGCTLPQIVPHRSVISGGQPPSDSWWNANANCRQSPFKHPSEVFPIKQEHGNNQFLSCNLRKDLPTSLQLHGKSKTCNQFSPMSTSHPNMQHLRLPGGNSAQSPAFSDVSTIRLTPHPPLSRVPSGEALKFSGGCRGRLKSEFRSSKSSLPPLSGYNSNTDLDEANPSPLIPPVNSLSPYLGSEYSSFPSLLSPRNPTQLSRKRALSTSPFSDLLDFNSVLRSSPNSLAALLGGSTPISPNPTTGTIGHMVGHTNPASQMQQIQQRKTSIEHTQNRDGTTNTTITNQITISEHPHTQLVKYMPSETKAAQPRDGSEPMDYDHLDAKGNTSGRSQQHLHNPSDPHICLWKTCGKNFEELDDLVQHIENVHIEKGKLDDFTCMWQACPRNRKPFNARYKLLIHMRIHSGEKPNKCTVSSRPVELLLHNHT